MNDWSDAIDPTQLADWLTARTLWLAALERRSARTAHEYARVWTAFYATAHGGRLAPWAVESSHAYAWAAVLSRRLAPASVNKSISILASYYAFCQGRRLWRDGNPFSGEHLRAHVGRYERSRYPSTDQVRAILERIDTSSAIGLRDYALFGGLFATTRRLNEWLPLRWADFTGNVFSTQVKGGRIVRQILPDGQLAAIVAWLTAAGRNPPGPDDYVFCAPPTWDRHLNPGYVNRRLRYYGRLAGVPERLCHAHGLRHAGARWRYAQGATAYQLQQTLCHRSIQTTEIYIRAVLQEPEDALAPQIDRWFGGLTNARIQSSRACLPTPTNSIARNAAPAPLEVACVR